MWPFSTKKSRAWSSHLVLSGLGPAQWSKRNYRAFSEEAYQYNVIANSAINRLANAVSTIRWRVKLSSGEIKREHPMLDLLKRPNPMQSGPEWWKARIAFLMLSGNIYDEAVIAGGKIKELYPLRPDRMTIIPSDTGLPRGYIYKVNNREITFSCDPLTGLGPINHTKLFHPTDDWYGMSPIEAAAYGVDQHNESMSWVQSLLQNAARPSGALVMDKDTALSDDEFRRIKEEVETNYSGSRNAGRPMLLEGGLDWKQLGLSPVDMEILKSREMAARDISLAFGVPPLLLNIPGDNTYANYREARLGFYEDTVIPLVRHLTGDLNHFFQPYFKNAELDPDMDSVEAVAEKRQKLWAMADASDDITLNESRALKGLDPLPAPLGDMLMTEVRALGRGTAGDSPSPELDR